MTDADLQRRINRDFDVQSMKSRAALWVIALAGAGLLVAWVIS